MGNMRPNRIAIIGRESSRNNRVTGALRIAMEAGKPAWHARRVRELDAAGDTLGGKQLPPPLSTLAYG